MSSRKHKKKVWSNAVSNLRKMNSTRLQARLYSIVITKPAFLTDKQKKNASVIKAILKERGVKFNPREIFKNKRK